LCNTVTLSVSETRKRRTHAQYDNTGLAVNMLFLQYHKLNICVMLYLWMK